MESMSWKVNFMVDVSAEAEVMIDRATNLIYELREGRDQILKKYEVSDAEQLKDKIFTGKLEEHPAYEDYLGLQILLSTRESIRKEIKDFLQEL